MPAHPTGAGEVDHQVQLSGLDRQELAATGAARDGGADQRLQRRVVSLEGGEGAERDGGDAATTEPLRQVAGQGCDLGKLGHDPIVAGPGRSGALTAPQPCRYNRRTKEGFVVRRFTLALLLTLLSLAAVFPPPAGAQLEPVNVPWPQLLPPAPGSGGPQPAATASCHTATLRCVDGVIRRMDAAWQPLDRSCDHRAVFALTYLITTRGFRDMAPEPVLALVWQTPITLIVLRAMLGFTPSEWADAASARTDTDAPHLARAGRLWQGTGRHAAAGHG